MGVSMFFCLGTEGSNGSLFRNGWCGVILSRHIWRQLYNITTEELTVPALGADLGQGHLGVTVPFCTWISS